MNKVRNSSTVPHNVTSRSRGKALVALADIIGKCTELNLGVPLSQLPTSSLELQCLLHYLITATYVPLP